MPRFRTRAASHAVAATDTTITAKVSTDRRTSRLRCMVGRRRMAEFVADAVHGDQQLGLARVGFELLAQVLDVSVDGTFGNEPGYPVQVVQELGPAVDPPGGGGQHFKQAELGRRAVDYATVQCHLVAVRIYH